MRRAREAKGLRVRELGERVNVSPSLISQIEHGRTTSSVATLYAVCSALGISLDEVLGGDGSKLPAASEREQEPPGRVDRASERRLIQFAGVSWDLLNPGGTNGVEFLRVVHEPRGESTPEDSLLRHQGMEYGRVESGRLGVTVGFETHMLEAGDSIAFPSTAPHRVFNPSATAPAIALWLVIGRDADPRATE